MSKTEQAASLWDDNLNPEEFGQAVVDAGRGPLGRRFVQSPFTVLNAQAGHWKERKQRWIAIGKLTGEVGRKGVRTYNIGDGYELAGVVSKHKPTCPDPTSKDVVRSGRYVVCRLCGARGTAQMQGGAYLSIFDPVLCEVMYRWFCPPGGRILDPFAGGPTRGVVAAMMGYEYVGVEIRPEQIEANVANADEIGIDVPGFPLLFDPKRLEGVPPKWIEGNSTYLIDALNAADQEKPPYDLVLTCPPYYDLETYGGPDGDGSMLPDYQTFMTWLGDVLAQAVGFLKKNRFAIVVVGEIRDERGVYRGFVSDTAAILRDCEMTFYNEAVLVTAVGSAAVRGNYQFAQNRKLVRTHQNVLIFYNGDPKTVTKDLPALSDADAQVSPESGMS